MSFVNMFWILLPVFLTAFVLEVFLEGEVFLVPLLFPGYQIQGLQGGILGLGYGVHQGKLPLSDLVGALQGSLAIEEVTTEALEGRGGLSGEST